ncbi:Dolichyl-diphosphooligosaccharide-protein glycosyltransferase subunit dad1 [Gonapodya sp. JEL0774]|nr:Dolichyl-diphosphooligosaccharide-protein glycosyltransferase subunit dad1 [Gonapodya sp. JEL0774]
MSSSRSSLSSSSVPPSLSPSSLPALLSNAFSAYASRSSTKLKLIDAYLLFLILTGVIQFAYCLLVGSFPFNSFIAGFASSVGAFVLAVSLRVQISGNNPEYKDMPQERALAEYIFSQLVFSFFVVNYLG